MKGGRGVHRRNTDDSCSATTDIPKKAGGVIMKAHGALKLLLGSVLVVFPGYHHSVQRTDAASSAGSAAAASERFDVAIRHNSQDKEFREAMGEARRLLKAPIGTPPVPPDINLKCTEGVALERLGGVYYKSLVQPEEALCQRLLSAAKQLRLASSDAEEKANEAISMAGLLFKRNFRKVDASIRSYKPSAEKFGAVGYAALRVYKEGALLGEREAPPMAVLGDWAATIADKYLGELRNDHDYKAASAMLQLSKTAQMLGIPESDVAGPSELAAALAFKADFDVSCWVSAGSQSMKLEGKVEIAATGTQMRFVGEGGGKYISYTKGKSGGAKLQLPNAYAVTMVLSDFKPCEGTAKLIVDKIGSDSETWIVPELGKTLNAPGEEMDLFVKTLADQLFQGYRGEGGGFSFTLPIANMQAQMCTGAFTQTGSITTSEGGTSASITYNVTITHNPK